jgi:hypothetical protein
MPEKERARICRSGTRRTPDDGRRRRATSEREADDVTDRRGDLYDREISEREGQRERRGK